MTKNLRQRKPPKTRESVIHEFVIAGIKGYLTVGLYPDKTPCEIFINMSKEGSTISGLLDTVSIAVSMGLQYGIPMDKFVNKFSWMAFEPSGFTGSEEFGHAKSVIDYIFRWLGKKFAGVTPKEDKTMTDEIKDEPLVILNCAQQAPIADVLYVPPSPPCHNCGGETKRSGSCYCCTQCGETSGCS